MSDTFYPGQTDYIEKLNQASQNSQSAVDTVAQLASQLYVFMPSADIAVTEGTNASGEPTVTWTLTKAGSTNGSVPTSGQIGEDLSVAVLQSGAVALTTAVASVVASVVLQPGVYDVGGGTVCFTGTATTLSVCGGGVNSSSTLPALHLRGQSTPRANGLANGDTCLTHPSQRFYVPAGTTQTVNLVANAVFTGGTVSAYGELRVRRVA